MGLFGIGSKKKEIERLQKGNRQLNKRLNESEETAKKQRRRIKNLEALSDEKDSWMSRMASDALRHGSPLGGQVLSDKKKFNKKK